MSVAMVIVHGLEHGTQQNLPIVPKPNNRTLGSPQFTSPTAAALLEFRARGFVVSRKCKVGLSPSAGCG